MIIKDYFCEVQNGKEEVGKEEKEIHFGEGKSTRKLKNGEKTCWKDHVIVKEISVIEEKPWTLYWFLKEKPLLIAIEPSL